MTEDTAFLELRPVLATKEGRIYAGNMRYRAAKHLGWPDIPAIITDIDDKLANERAIKDNNEYGEWNNDELATLLDEMEKAGTDLSLLGLDESLQKIIDQLNEAEIIEDEAPPLPVEPTSKLGDLYILGGHRLLCGDATKIDDVEKLMNGEKADMVFTDPPYNIAYTSGTWSKQRKETMREIENDNMDDQSFIQFLADALSSVLIATSGGDQYICTDWKVFHLFRNAVEKVGQKIDTVIVWNKMYQTQALNKFANAHEFIIFIGENKYPLKDINVWDCKREFDPDHPTPKPIELVAKAVGYSSSQGGSVLDLFGGSGSTLIACEQLKRKCYMMELDPKYCDVIVQRWEKLTGKKAVLL